MFTMNHATLEEPSKGSVHTGYISLPAKVCLHLYVTFFLASPQSLPLCAAMYPVLRDKAATHNMYFDQAKRVFCGPLYSARLSTTHDVPHRKPDL